MSHEVAKALERIAGAMEETNKIAVAKMGMPLSDKDRDDAFKLFGWMFEPGGYERKKAMEEAELDREIERSVKRDGPMTDIERDAYNEDIELVRKLLNESYHSMMAYRIMPGGKINREQTDRVGRVLGDITGALNGTKWEID